ncbi:hypothetical protein Hanom_Chr06g00558761 [Helianthus anomalus]
MSSYRDGLKGSVVVSLLQARLRMAYEAEALGFECPSWNVKAWETKLADLKGTPVERPAKHTGEDPPKTTDAAAMLAVMLRRMPMVMLVQALMKQWLMRVLPLESSKVGDDGCLCRGWSPLF